MSVRHARGDDAGSPRLATAGKRNEHRTARRTDSCSGSWIPVLALPAVLAVALVGWIALLPGEQIPGQMDSELFQRHYFGDQFNLKWLRRGKVPLWNPGILGGVSWITDPEVGLLYPGRLVGLLAGSARGLTLVLTLHMLLAGWGMIVLVRRLGGGGGAAILAAVTYQLALPGVLRLTAGEVSRYEAYCLWPLLVWLLAGTRVAPVPGIGLAGLVVGLQLLAGDPVFAILGSATGFLVVSFVAGGEESSPGKPAVRSCSSHRRPAPTGAAATLAALALGLAIGAPAWLPGLFHRGLGDLPVADPAPVTALVNLVVPGVYGDQVRSEYVGGAPIWRTFTYLGLVPWILCLLTPVLDRRLTRLAIGCLVLPGLGLAGAGPIAFLLLAGPLAVVTALAFERLSCPDGGDAASPPLATPGVPGGDRAPRRTAGSSRALMVAGGCLVIVAAATVASVHLGLDESGFSGPGKVLLSRGELGDIPPPLEAEVDIVKIRMLRRVADEALVRFAVLAGLIGFLLLALARDWYYERRLKALLLLVAAADLWSLSQRYVSVSPFVISDTVRGMVGRAATLSANFRVEAPPLPVGAALDLGLSGISGRSDPLPEALIELHEDLVPGRSRVRPSELRLLGPTPLSRLLGVRYWITHAQMETDARGLERLARKGDIELFEDAGARPLAFFETRLDEVGDRREALFAMKVWIDDPARSLPVERVPVVRQAARFSSRSPAAPASASRPVSIRLNRLDPQDLEIEITVPTAGWVVLTEAWDPGWSLVLDGVEVVISRACGWAMAFPVGPSSQHARLTYRPVGFFPSLWLGLLGLLGALALIGSRSWSRRPGSTVATPDTTLPG